MKNTKKLYLVCHAEHTDPKSDSSLSDKGKRQADMLARLIFNDLEGTAPAAWSSSARAALETMIILNNVFDDLELKLFDMLRSKKDPGGHDHGFEWLKSELEAFEGNALVIISDTEHVRGFPRFIGFDDNESGYAQGVCIENEECRLFGVGIDIE